MAGFNLSFGVGLSYRKQNNTSVSSGEIPEMDSCFSTGTWIGNNPWIMSTTWNYSSKSAGVKEPKSDFKSKEEYFNF